MSVKLANGSVPLEPPASAADLEYRIAKLELAPGDVLVVKVDHTLSADIGGRIRDHFEAVVGAGAKMLILDRSIDLSVLSKAEIDKRTG